MNLDASVHDFLSSLPATEVECEIQITSVNLLIKILRALKATPFTAHPSLVELLILSKGIS
jgi:hypothetical protein